MEEIFVPQRARVTPCCKHGPRAGFAGQVRRAWLVVSLLLLAMTTVARGAEAVQPSREDRLVLLVATAPESPREAARLETLRIHLTDVAARVLIAPPAESATTTQQRVSGAITLGRQKHAVAVLFIEELGSSELRLYWVDPKQGRAWMRQLSIGSDGTAAADETAALVARGGLEELLEAGRMSMKPVATVPPVVAPRTAQADTTERRTATPTRRFRAGVAYQGTSFAPQASWQNGVQLMIAARLAHTFYLAAKHTFTEAITVTSSGVTAHLVRRPTELAFGYRAEAPLALRSELGVFADHVARSTTGVATDQRPTDDQARVFVGASLRLGLELRLGPRLRLVGLGGAEFLFNGFDYLSDDASQRVALKVRRLRPLVEAGLVAELW